jgi:hypothetical protein
MARYQIIPDIQYISTKNSSYETRIYSGKYLLVPTMHTGSKSLVEKQEINDALD